MTGLKGGFLVPKQGLRKGVFELSFGMPTATFASSNPAPKTMGEQGVVGAFDAGEFGGRAAAVVLAIFEKAKSAAVAPEFEKDGLVEDDS